jgi:hypothetical protein
VFILSLLTGRLALLAGGCLRFFVYKTIIGHWPNSCNRLLKSICTFSGAKREREYVGWQAVLALVLVGDEVCFAGVPGFYVIVFDTISRILRLPIVLIAALNWAVCD